MKVGYVIKNEDMKSVIDNMENLGIQDLTIEFIATDKKQPKLVNTIEDMKENDVLVVNTYQDLGFNHTQRKIIFQKLEEKNIGLQILDKDFFIPDHALDRKHIFIRRVLLKTLYVFENELKNRQMEAKERMNELKNNKSGRPKKYSMYSTDEEAREVYYNAIEMLENNVPVTRIAEELNISRSTVYAIRKEIEVDKKSDNQE